MRKGWRIRTYRHHLGSCNSWKAIAYWSQRHGDGNDRPDYIYAALGDTRDEAHDAVRNACLSDPRWRIIAGEFTQKRTTGVDFSPKVSAPQLLEIKMPEGNQSQTETVPEKNTDQGQSGQGGQDVPWTGEDTPKQPGAQASEDMRESRPPK